jgi:hypothetical protein
MRLSDYADSITTPLVLNPAQSDRNGYASTSTRHNRDVGIMSSTQRPDGRAGLRREEDGTVPAEADVGRSGL